MLSNIGKAWSRLKGIGGGRPAGPKIKVVMLGLSGAGKSTILRRLTHHRDGAIEDVMPNRHCPACFKDDYTERVENTMPMISWNVARLTSPTTRLEVISWDVGGVDRIRSIWRHYYRGADALVFVVDSSDRERMEEAKGELHRTLTEHEMMALPLLVLANKQDDLDLPYNPDAATLSEIRRELGLDGLGRERRWRLQGASAFFDIGIHEGFEWIVKGCPDLSKTEYDILLLRELYVRNRASLKRGSDDRQITNVLHFLCRNPPELSTIVDSFIGNVDRRVQGVERISNVGCGIL